MATLSDFIKNVRFDQVYQILCEKYQDAENFKQIYDLIFTSLQAAKPYPSPVGMQLALRLNEFDLWDDEDEPTVQAVGILPGDEDYYAVGSLEPDALAGLELDGQTAAQCSPAEVAACCVTEVVYFATAADSAWGAKNDTAAKGLIASQNCLESEVEAVSLSEYRQEMGLEEEKPQSGTGRFFR